MEQQHLTPPPQNDEKARLSLIAAVRRYASEPTDANADGVAEAVSQMRRIRALSDWREKHR
jgi:hypothetical protein